jgi:hypothetical protein
MAQIVLDISANTHRNDEAYYKRMINELAGVDSRKHEVILKWQLFKEAGENRIPHEMLFEDMCYWAFNKHGYRTTASVFDIPSLSMLLDVAYGLDYQLPFVKIANRRDLDWLIGEIPRKYRVYKSVGTEKEYHFKWRTCYDCYAPEWEDQDIETLFCVSNYPADISDYPKGAENVSDHTIGLDLWYRNKPLIWEKHYKLPDSTGLDAGPFATTPQELKEIL